MKKELVDYLIYHGRKWMLPEELRALSSIGLPETSDSNGSTFAERKIELLYGPNDEKSNLLINLGEDRLRLTIATRLLKDVGNDLINNCPKCGKLARTPTAKQCRYCEHDWH